MKKMQRILIVVAAMLMFACGSHPAKTDAADSASSSNATPAKAEAAKKDDAKKKEITAGKVPEGEIIGKPAKGSKFAKLKIGMTLKQVEDLIGKPTKQWQHPTGKVSIPFYFGPDRWVIQYSYKGEGVLTLNYGEEQLLTRVEVNKAE